MAAIVPPRVPSQTTRPRALVGLVALVATAAFLVWPRDVPPEPLAEEEMARAVEGVSARLAESAGTRKVLPADAISGDVANHNMEVRGLRGLSVISGVVLAAEDGRPLAGADVELRGWPSSDAAVAAYRKALRWKDPPPIRTAADGRFAFSPEPLPPLGWDLFVRAPQRATAHRRWWRLQADRVEEPCEIKLAREVTVHAIAVTEDGSPAPGACVDLTARRAPERPGAAVELVTAEADAGGNLDFGALPVGKYPAAGSRSGLWRVIGAPEIEVAGNGVASGGRIVVAAVDARIAGRVLDDVGNVVAGVGLHVATEVARSGGVLGRARTDAGGRFVVGRHDAGEDGAAIRLVLADGSVLAPAPTWNGPLRDYVAKRRGSVRLRVVGDGDRPVLRYCVEWLGGKKPARLGSLGGHHADGECDLGECAAGTTFLDVVPGGEELGRAGVVAIVVGPASAQTVVVKLVPPVRRTIRVATRGGEPAAGAEVTVCVVPPGLSAEQVPAAVRPWRHPQDGKVTDVWQLLRTTTDTQGQADVVLPVSLTHYAIVVSQEGFARTTAMHVLDVQQPRGAIDVVLSAGATVRGRVLPADFAQRAGPIFGGAAKTMVFATPVNEHSWAPGAALENGAFELRGMAPGSYKLRVGENAYVAIDAPTPVDIQDDRETIDVVVDLRAHVPGSLRACVVADGRPVSRVPVRLLGGKWGGGASTTDDDGMCSFPAVTPGRRWLRAEGVGTDPEPIEIQAGVAHDRTFHLESARVVLRLLRPDGSVVRQGAFALEAQPDGVSLGTAMVKDDRLVFDLVPPGTFRVRRLALPEQAELQGSIVVPKGARNVVLDLSLVAAAAHAPR